MPSMLPTTNWASQPSWMLKERRRETDLLKTQDILRKQRSADDAGSELDGRPDLDNTTVRNLIGRSSSIKATKEGGTAVRRAISFRSREPGEMTAAPPVLQKALEFRQGEGVITPPPMDDGEPAPDLPAAPPPEMRGEPRSPLSKKDQLSSPTTSPKHQKHLENVKSEDKKKRTPSFNLRGRTRSFKDKHRLPDNLPPEEMEGALERKQELQSGGKKATMRTWKNYYCVLFGQLMCFFKDKEGYQERYAAAPPLNLHQATCDPATDYTKKKHVLRLKLHDGAEFLLEAPSQPEMIEWNRHINRLAAESAMFADMEFNHNDEDEEEMAPTYDASALINDGDQRSPSPTGRGRSISPTSPRVETIPEHGAPVQQPPEPVVQHRQPDSDVNRSDSFKEQNNREMPSRVQGSPRGSPIGSPRGPSSASIDILSYSAEPRKRPEPSSRSQQRPMSEPVQPPGSPPDDHDEKEKKRKSMFSFLKKKKDKEHHDGDHDKSRDSHKKHKK